LAEICYYDSSKQHLILDFHINSYLIDLFVIVFFYGKACKLDCPADFHFHLDLTILHLLNSHQKHLKMFSFLIAWAFVQFESHLPFFGPALKLLYWFGKVAREFPSQHFGKTWARVFTLSVLSVPLYVSRTTESAVTESETLLPCNIAHTQWLTYILLHGFRERRWVKERAFGASTVVYILSYFWRQNRTTVAVDVYTSWQGAVVGVVSLMWVIGSWKNIRNSLDV